MERAPGQLLDHQPMERTSGRRLSHELGGAGGEALGGSWVLLVSLAGLRAKSLPTALSCLGLATGVAGLVSNIPPLRESAAMFGLLQIVWFVWLGIVLLRTPQGESWARHGGAAPQHRPA